MNFNIIKKTDFENKSTVEILENASTVQDGNIIINIICYISHAVMMNQILEMDGLYESVERYLKLKYKQTLTAELLRKAIEICNKSCVITGATDKYLYQTTSTLHPVKSVKEIMNIVCNSK